MVEVSGTVREQGRSGHPWRAGSFPGWEHSKLACRRLVLNHRLLTTFNQHVHAMGFHLGLCRIHHVFGTRWAENSVAPPPRDLGKQHGSFRSVAAYIGVTRPCMRPALSQLKAQTTDTSSKLVETRGPQDEETAETGK